MTLPHNISKKNTEETMKYFNLTFHAVRDSDYFYVKNIDNQNADLHSILEGVPAAFSFIQGAPALPQMCCPRILLYCAVKGLDGIGAYFLSVCVCGDVSVLMDHNILATMKVGAQS